MSAQLSLLVLISASLGQTELDSADWPQWRGPNRDSQVTSGDWPDSLSEDHLKTLWQVDLEPSYSGPIVVGSRVFVTETRDRSHEVVKAFDRHTGQQLWNVEWPGAMSVPFFAKANGDWIRSTPACDGSRLYVAGMKDVLVCLEVETGTEVWRKDIAEEFDTGLESFGFVCSPLIDGDGVIVQSSAGTIKVNKLTGELVWRMPDAELGMMGGSFSSPIIATLAERRQLIVQTRQEMMGLDPDAGEQLWSKSIPAFRGMNILTPLMIGDQVFTCTYGGGAHMLSMDRTDQGFEVRQVWETKMEGYMSSPVLVDNSIYVHLKNQRLACVDPLSGKERWRSKPFGKYWSMAVNGDHILALDERGELLLIDADPNQLIVLDRRMVSEEPAWAHLAVSGNHVFVRSINHLTVFEMKQ
ncbi:MAG: PQQ-binding-like beta-propeller repeat protein [Planctomycetaceae bacterium]|nr:PQQ-binding-like beta-propeller repeat protein [Planctomycetaceae bacterium]